MQTNKQQSDIYPFLKSCVKVFKYLALVCCYLNSIVNMKRHALSVTFSYGSKYNDKHTIFNILIAH